MNREHERIQERLAAGWRMRCPEGHADLRDKDGPTVYCRSCRSGYHYDDLVDARETGVPVGNG